MLLKVVNLHGQTQRCKEFAEASLKIAFTSKQGLHSAFVTSDIIVDNIMLKGSEDVASII